LIHPKALLLGHCEGKPLPAGREAISLLHTHDPIALFTIIVKNPGRPLKKSKDMQSPLLRVNPERSLALRPGSHRVDK
jgi:hypothetical protein